MECAKQIREQEGEPLSKTCRAEIYLKSYTHTPSYKLPRLGKCLQQLFLPERGDVQIRLTISFSTEENGYSQKWLKNKESCLPLQLEKKRLRALCPEGHFLATKVKIIS